MLFDIFVRDHISYFYICLERMSFMSEILKSPPSVCQISQNPKSNVFKKLQILFCLCWSWVTCTSKIFPIYNFNKWNLLIIFSSSCSLWGEGGKKKCQWLFSVYFQVGIHRQENVYYNFQIRKLRKSSYQLSCYVPIIQTDSLAF